METAGFVAGGDLACVDFFIFFSQVQTARFVATFSSMRTNSSMTTHIW